MDQGLTLPSPDNAGTIQWTLPNGWQSIPHPDNAGALTILSPPQRVPHQTLDQLEEEILDAFQRIFGDETMAALRLLSPENLDEKIVQFASDNPYINKSLRELLDVAKRERTQPPPTYFPKPYLGPGPRTTPPMRKQWRRSTGPSRG